MVKISIITINYNNAEGLERTMDSVVSQTYPNIEYLIIDGGSSDGSVNVIKKHATKVAYWVSERDRGIYHAMNKGIAKASGDYLLFLNSGDILYDESIVDKVVLLQKDEDVIYGHLMFENGTHRRVDVLPRTLSFGFFVEYSLPHPASFIKKKVFEKVGLYDEMLKIVSDWKFFMDAIVKNNSSYKKVDLVVSIFNEEGISSNPENEKLIQKERHEVLTKEYGAILIQECKKNYKLVSNIKLSRLIGLIRKIGFLPHLDLDNG
jgi:glycosyltransferase involved in cell wall biosynthesis